MSFGWIVVHFITFKAILLWGNLRFPNNKILLLCTFPSVKDLLNCFIFISRVLHIHGIITFRSDKHYPFVCNNGEFGGGSLEGNFWKHVSICSRYDIWTSLLISVYCDSLYNILYSCLFENWVFNLKWAKKRLLQISKMINIWLFCDFWPPTSY